MGKGITSCENCRRSRLGCNAALSQPDQACFNCARKGVSCTFKRSPNRIRTQTKLSASQQRLKSREVGSLSSFKPSAVAENPGDDITILPEGFAESDPSLTSPPMISEFSNSLSRSHQALRLHNLLWNVFTSLLEPRIGLWISGAGCPLMGMNSVSLRGSSCRLSSLTD